MKTKGSLSLEVRDSVGDIDAKTRDVGMAFSFLARGLGMWRQYLYKMLNVGDPLWADDVTVRTDMAHRATLGHRLKRVRVLSGLSIRAAADQIGYTHGSVARWEKDQYLPKPGVLLPCASSTGSVSICYAPSTVPRLAASARPTSKES